MEAAILRHDRSDTAHFYLVNTPIIGHRMYYLCQTVKGAFYNASVTKNYFSFYAASTPLGVSIIPKTICQDVCIFLWKN